MIEQRNELIGRTNNEANQDPRIDDQAHLKIFGELREDLVGHAVPGRLFPAAPRDLHEAFSAAIDDDADLPVVRKAELLEFFSSLANGTFDCTSHRSHSFL